MRSQPAQTTQRAPTPPHPPLRLPPDPGAGFWGSGFRGWRWFRGLVEHAPYTSTSYTSAPHVVRRTPYTITPTPARRPSCCGQDTHPENRITIYTAICLVCSKRVVVRCRVIPQESAPLGCQALGGETPEVDGRRRRPGWPGQAAARDPAFSARCRTPGGRQEGRRSGTAVCVRDRERHFTKRER